MVYEDQVLRLVNLLVFDDIATAGYGEMYW